MSVEEQLRRAKARLLRKYRAHGVGIGYKYVGGRRTDQIAIVFFVHRKRPLAELQRMKVEAIPERLFGLPTDVREVREGFRPFQRVRPVTGGVSGISFKEAGAAGTLGYVNRQGEVLSNNHVMAAEDLTVSHTAVKGDAIIQPSYLDGGSYPQDTVAQLDRWVSITPITPISSIKRFFCRLFRLKCSDQANYIDGAVAKMTVGFTPGVYGLGEAEGYMEPQLGMRVLKRGRTTGLTYGTVTAVNVSTNVFGYQGIYIAHFEDQIAIEGEQGDFSSAGDSGSTIHYQDEGGKYWLVALLFAGGGGITIATPAKYISSLLSYSVP